eukprot:765867-Hanusia_phi.AAC.1
MSGGGGVFSPRAQVVQESAPARALVLGEYGSLLAANNPQRSIGMFSKVEEEQGQTRLADALLAFSGPVNRPQQQVGSSSSSLRRCTQSESRKRVQEGVAGIWDRAGD